MKIVRLTALTLFAAAALSSYAALSRQYADFAKGPYQYLLTNEERRHWSAVATDEQAKLFIDLFWARRDPTPATPANEFRDMIDQRIAVADSRFQHGKLKGSQTDRGKVFIALGSPTKIRRKTGEPVSTIQTPGSGGDRQTSQPDAPGELWQYEQGEIKIPLGQPNAEFGFVDQYGSGDFKLEIVPRTDYKAVFDRVANSYITQPKLSEVPTYTAAAPAAPAAAAPVAAAPAAAANTDALTNETLRSAVTAARNAKASDVLFLTTGEFITGTGENFVPIQLYAPKSAGLTVETPVTFFGVVETEGGERVQSYEEPVTLRASGDAVYYGRSLTLAPGRYRGTFGLAREGKPVAVVTQPIVVAGLDKSAPGVSPLMLSSNIFPMTEAQRPTDPFAFGGLQVVPKGDPTFRRSEDLWYFFELRNPGLDTASSKPNLTMAMSVIGTSTEGKKVKMLGPASPVDAQEVKGVPGHWGVGQAMPLASFRPGNYTFTVKLTDSVLNKTYELSAPFRVIE
ncbi:MAG: GWxTD domain-containing protein [Acidobacteriota bacterium]|nr:GWxTD domain-containing protein [Acidobacteriota bacterium]